MIHLRLRQAFALAMIWLAAGRGGVLRAQSTGPNAACALSGGTGIFAADSSGHGNTALTNGTTWTTAGRFGKALTFDGTYDAPQRTALVSTASQYRWSTADREEVGQLLSDAPTVLEFLNEIANKGADTPEKLVEAVKEYRLLDLFGDGSLALVALIDESGRGFFNTIEVVTRDRRVDVGRSLVTQFQGFAVRQVYGFYILGLDSSVKDIDGDGEAEIIVPVLLERYRSGVNPHAEMMEIYRWNGQDYERASASFPWYYEQVILPKLIAERQLIDATVDSGFTSFEKSLLRQRKAKSDLELAEARRRALAQ